MCCYIGQYFTVLLNKVINISEPCISVIVLIRRSDSLGKPACIIMNWNPGFITVSARFTPDLLCPHVDFVQHRELVGSSLCACFPHRHYIQKSCWWLNQISHIHANQDGSVLRKKGEKSLKLKSQNSNGNQKDTPTIPAETTPALPDGLLSI